MTRPKRYCLNHEGRQAARAIQVRYWWGNGPEVELCDPCIAAMVRAVTTKHRHTGFRIRIDVRRLAVAGAG